MQGRLSARKRKMKAIQSPLVCLPPYFVNCFLQLQKWAKCLVCCVRVGPAIRARVVTVPGERPGNCKQWPMNQTTLAELDNVLPRNTFEHRVPPSSCLFLPPFVPRGKVLLVPLTKEMGR